MWHMYVIFVYIYHQTKKIKNTYKERKKEKLTNTQKTQAEYMFLHMTHALEW